LLLVGVGVALEELLLALVAVAAAVVLEGLGLELLLQSLREPLIRLL
jgi:hypothetical protein